MNWSDMSADEKLGAVYRYSRKGLSARQIAAILSAPSAGAVNTVAIRHDIKLTRSERTRKPADLGLPRNTVPFWHLPPRDQRAAVADRAARAATLQRRMMR